LGTNITPRFPVLPQMKSTLTTVHYSAGGGGGNGRIVKLPPGHKIVYSVHDGFYVEVSEEELKKIDATNKILLELGT
jgi:hypothetical protein